MDLWDRQKTESHLLINANVSNVENLEDLEWERDFLRYQRLACVLFRCIEGRSPKLFILKYAQFPSSGIAASVLKSHQISPSSVLLFL
jgi:hypothetical protein